MNFIRTEAPAQSEITAESLLRSVGAHIHQAMQVTEDCRQDLTNLGRQEIRINLYLALELLEVVKKTVLEE